MHHASFAIADEWKEKYLQCRARSTACKESRIINSILHTWSTLCLWIASLSQHNSLHSFHLNWTRKLFTAQKCKDASNFNIYADMGLHFDNHNSCVAYCCWLVLHNSRYTIQLLENIRDEMECLCISLGVSSHVVTDVDSNIAAYGLKIDSIICCYDFADNEHDIYLKWLKN